MIWSYHKGGGAVVTALVLVHSGGSEEASHILTTSSCASFAQTCINSFTFFVVVFCSYIHTYEILYKVALVLCTSTYATFVILQEKKRRYFVDKI